MAFLTTVIGVELHYCLHQTCSAWNKEKDNLHDDEAIIAADFDIEESEDLADIIELGEEDARYVANSVNTVARGTYFAGRLYDKFNKNLIIKVIFAVHGVFICEVTGELTE